MLEEADTQETEYFKLRAKAIVSLFRTGKRRAALTTLEMDDLEIRDNYLYVTFAVVKKRGKSELSKRRTKRYPLSSRYAQHILEYWKYMKQHHPQTKYLFPSGHSVFGQTFIFDYHHHLSGRQILRIIKQLDENAWCHLFRETRGAEIIRKDEEKRGEASIMTVYRVKHALDLESERTAWNYIRRYATETVGVEEDTIA